PISCTRISSALYFAGENGLLLALDKNTGAEKWRFQQPETAIPFSPAVADGTVYVPVSNGILYALDATTGEEQWR
ncbi:MAG TPA: PQQ-binding-like beta-propeller repeat protein, partial [Promineifilum sp.]|nr:PQQ-binding-like beta-propeller repeat protein [Promineifilum sp.]